MATGVEWLQKQKKADLSELAEHVGLKSYTRMKRSELEVALEDHLRTNTSTFSTDSTAAPFYQGVDPASPVKHKGGKAIRGGMAEDEKKPRARRQTMKAKEEAEGTSSSTPTTTPSRALTLAKSVPLPPSPAQLATAIDIRTTSIRNSLSNTFTSPRLARYALTTRDTLSSSISITLLTLFIELWGLRASILPMKYAFTIPAVPALGTASVNVTAPDFFALVTAAFWAPLLTWGVVCVALPGVAAWTVNLQGANAGKGGGSRADVVSFNVVKGVLAWVVFARRGVEGESVGVVERGVPGGSAGMMVGAMVGVVAGVYEAVLRK